HLRPPSRRAAPAQPGLHGQPARMPHRHGPAPSRQRGGVRHPGLRAPPVRQSDLAARSQDGPSDGARPHRGAGVHAGGRRAGPAVRELRGCSTARRAGPRLFLRGFKGGRGRTTGASRYAHTPSYPGTSRPGTAAGAPWYNESRSPHNPTVAACPPMWGRRNRGARDAPAPKVAPCCLDGTQSERSPIIVRRVWRVRSWPSDCYSVARANAEEATVILSFNFEELRALESGAEMFIAEHSRPSGGSVAAPSEALADVQR